MTNKKEIALGTTCKTRVNTIEDYASCSDSQKILIVLSKIKILEDAITNLYKKIKKSDSNAYVKNIPVPVVINNKVILNKDGIPVNTILVGVSFGRTYLLTVNSYNYMVENISYPTLSAAAEAVSGNRRSGWSFWKTLEGHSVKEVFKVSNNVG